MTLVKWQKQFEIGVPEIDYEHRNMIELLNLLHDNLTAGAGDDEILTFLADVYANISSHFALEERLMQEIDYAGFPSHKADHEDLLDQINDIIENFESGDYANQLSRLSDDLEVWFTRHFKEQDAPLHQSFNI